MSSTFFGLNIAGSGLNVFQNSINTTANNIANVDTEGYSRQVVNKSASSALRVFEKYGSTSTGVTADSVTQMRDEYYDVKYWAAENNYGFYEKKEYYMDQIEDYFTDKVGTSPGFSTLFADMFNSLYNVETSAGDLTARTNFVSGAQKLVTFFHDTAEKLQNLQLSINDEIKTTVDQINTISKKISLLNKQINVIEIEGGHANDLRDSR
ncbi:MAG: flagellar hook-associated protein FlgK, partial [Lachnospiraceae bacterium]|nr:flagellar hook-associated protein FlgK [Lachnospiraceae bacterium]